MPSNITENQIIDHLERKKARLLEELEKTELALNALNRGKTISTIDPTRKNTEPSLHLKPVNQFDSNLKIDEKIAFALTNLKSATKKEIIDFLIKTEPGLDQKKLENNIAVRLSTLLTDNLIEGTKKGRTYCYNLYNSN